MHRIALFLLLCLLGGPANAGTVRCECPSISAKGTGDTSCSATETGSSCTVDFNTFSLGDEEAALALLAAAVAVGGGGEDVKWFFFDRREFPGGLNPESLFRLEGEPEALVDTLLIYVLVSAVQAAAQPDLGLIAEVRMSLRNNASAVAEAFRSGVTEFSSGQADVFVTAGCIEIKANSFDYWGMYKAFWSDAVERPQCRP